MLIKRTPAEWELVMCFKIIDWQGWRCSHGRYKPKVSHKRISRREFFCRAMHSLIKYNKHKGE